MGKWIYDEYSRDWITRKEAAERSAMWDRLREQRDEVYRAHLHDRHRAQCEAALAGFTGAAKPPQELELLEFAP